jgi:tRNA (cytidine/uridine-2'-O-)-methyltransferase
MPRSLAESPLRPITSRRILRPRPPSSHSSVFHLVLYQPEIPPNTGNAIRLSANAGCRLHLIRPLAFDLSEKAVRRAGMDYAELAHVEQWDSLEKCLEAVAATRWFAVSTRGATRYDQLAFQPGDAFVFGPETRGLPQDVLARCPPSNQLRIPMRPGNRSLNLSNAIAVVTYEAWRQLGFR